MPKRDERQIRLDPMEWRDAMRDVKPEAGEKKKAKPAKPAKPAAKKK